MPGKKPGGILTYHTIHTYHIIWDLLLICPDSCKPPLMPLCHTIHMGICHMPVWGGPYTICPYGHMPIYMPIWSGSYKRARSTSCVATTTSIRTTRKIPRPIPETARLYDRVIISGNRYKTPAEHLLIPYHTIWECHHMPMCHVPI